MTVGVSRRVGRGRHVADLHRTGSAGHGVKVDGRVVARLEAEVEGRLVGERQGGVVKGDRVRPVAGAQAGGERERQVGVTVAIEVGDLHRLEARAGREIALVGEVRRRPAGPPVQT